MSTDIRRTTLGVMQHRAVLARHGRERPVGVEGPIDRRRGVLAIGQRACALKLRRRKRGRLIEALRLGDLAAQRVVTPLRAVALVIHERRPRAVLGVFVERGNAPVAAALPLLKLGGCRRRS